MRMQNNTASILEKLNALKPSAATEELINSLLSRTHWKHPTSAFITSDHAIAQEVARGLDWFLGGHEISLNEDGNYVVQSRGYFHYIGA